MSFVPGGHLFHSLGPSRELSAIWKRTEGKLWSSSQLAAGPMLMLFPSGQNNTLNCKTKEPLFT